MPANLTPEYKRADQRYREAETPSQRLEALEEMLRTEIFNSTDLVRRIIAQQVRQGRVAVQDFAFQGRDKKALDRIFQ